jgi:hypothetical protein
VKNGVSDVKMAFSIILSFVNMPIAFGRLLSLLCNSSLVMLTSSEQPIREFGLKTKLDEKVLIQLIFPTKILATGIFYNIFCFRGQRLILRIFYQTRGIINHG